MGLRFRNYTLAACPVTSPGLGEDGTSSSVVSAYSSHLQLPPYIPVSRETVLFFLAKSLCRLTALLHTRNVVSVPKQNASVDKTSNLAREVTVLTFELEASFRITCRESNM